LFSPFAAGFQTVPHYLNYTSVGFSLKKFDNSYHNCHRNNIIYFWLKASIFGGFDFCGLQYTIRRDYLFDEKIIYSGIREDPSNDNMFMII